MESYSIITINSCTKEVVKNEVIKGWYNALKTIVAHASAARQAGFKTENKGEYTVDIPHYMERNCKINNGIYATSFSMFKWDKENNQPIVFFTYIKKAAIQMAA